MSPVAEEALRERAAMGDLTPSQITHYAAVALNYAQESRQRGDLDAAERHARFAADMIRTYKAVKS
jgi:hypothetical protein